MNTKHWYQWVKIHNSATWALAYCTRRLVEGQGNVVSLMLIGCEEVFFKEHVDEWGHIEDVREPELSCVH